MPAVRLTGAARVEEARGLLLHTGETVPVRWVRDPRARRLRLIVNDRGIRLTVPRSASVRLAESFLLDHRDWLQVQLAKRPVSDDTPFSRDNDHELPLRNQRIPIQWREGRYARAELGDHAITLTQSSRGSGGQLRSALKEFYLQQARIDLGLWMPRYLPTLPRGPMALKLRALSSLWGSLSPTDSLSLDLALVLARPSAFEYVLVHELCHLLQRNHSRRFWAEVERRCPAWRLERSYLHGDGLAVKKELRRLIG